jgi:hypothetical protein
MMLIDLTEKMRLARENETWTEALFCAFLDKLSGAFAGAKIDWDDGAGEEWGRVLWGKELLALVWLRGAFVFVGASHTEIFSPLFLGSSVQFEVVDDWDKSQYQIDRGVLLQLIGRGKISDAFDSRQFSASDLWWATV